MPVIAMTREIGCLGTEVATGVAKRLGLEIVRSEVAANNVARRLGVAEGAVLRYLDGSASLLERWQINRRKLFHYAAEEILGLAQHRNVLIKGWGAATLLRDVPHVISVRVCAPMDFRVRVLMERQGRKDAHAVREEIERFDAAARRSLVSAEHRLLKTMGAAAPSIFSTLARRFDLSVFMQSEPNGVDNDDMIQTSLFESGRPLIVVPYIQKDGLKLDHVVCCWDGSRAAARAINDGLPLLVKARTVDLLIVLNEKTDNPPNVIRGAEMAKHLARHDVKVHRLPTSTFATRSCLTSPTFPER